MDQESHDSQASGFVNERMTPGKNWKKFQCRILGEPFSSVTEARKALKIAEVSSDLESREKKKTRKKVEESPPVHKEPPTFLSLNPSSSGEKSKSHKVSGSASRTESPIQSTSSKSHHHSNEKSKKSHGSSHSHSKRRKMSTRSPQVLDSDADTDNNNNFLENEHFSVPAPASVLSVGTPAFSGSQVLRNSFGHFSGGQAESGVHSNDLKDIYRILARIEARLKQLANDFEANRNVQCSGKHSVESRFSGRKLVFPLKSVEEVNSAEDRLASEVELCDWLKSYVKQIGGDEVRVAVKMSMFNLMTEETLAKYSKAGAKGKLKFTDLKMHSILEEVISEVEGFTKFKIGNEIEYQLKHAQTPEQKEAEKERRRKVIEDKARALQIPHEEQKSRQNLTTKNNNNKTKSKKDKNDFFDKSDVDSDYDDDVNDAYHKSSSIKDNNSEISSSDSSSDGDSES